LVRDVLPQLAPPDGCTIFYEVKADLRGADMEVMARARVTEVQPGIEALATSTLRLMDKGTTSLQNIVFLKHCVMFGIAPAWNLLMGFPGESEDTFRRYVHDLPRLVHLPPPAGAYPVRFDRYSPYHTKAGEYNLDLHASDFYRFLYPFGDEVIDKLAYYFTDQRVDAPYQLALSRWIEPVQQKVDVWRRLWHTAGSQRPRLELCGREGAQTIRDSRGETPIDYEADSLVVELLRHLDKPRCIDRVRETRRDLDWLRERDLLFEDGDHCVSLVLLSTSNCPKTSPGESGA
jgi:magnesium-protoporphyrin IX monomethyl ester (oxidative) cyclase